MTDIINLFYLQKCNCTFVSIGLLKTNIKLLTLNLYFLVVKLQHHLQIIHKSHLYFKRKILTLTFFEV